MDLQDTFIENKPRMKILNGTEKKLDISFILGHTMVQISNVGELDMPIKKRFY